MIVYPSIDVLGEEVVRLERGNFDRPTVYGDDPVEAALRWAAEGAEALHVVDLDGARSGGLENFDAIDGILKEVKLPVQVGGGIRHVDQVARYMAAGAARVVVGTSAFRDRAFLDEIVRRWPGRIVVAVDAKGGKVAVEGWQETTSRSAVDFIGALPLDALAAVLYTDIARDGTMEGPNFPAIAEAARASRGRLIASGGVGSLKHLRSLARSASEGVSGVILGKSLYEKRFTLEEAKEAVADPRDG